MQHRICVVLWGHGESASAWLWRFLEYSWEPADKCASQLVAAADEHCWVMGLKWCITSLEWSVWQKVMGLIDTPCMTHDLAWLFFYVQFHEVLLSQRSRFEPMFHVGVGPVTNWYQVTSLTFGGSFLLPLNCIVKQFLLNGQQHIKQPKSKILLWNIAEELQGTCISIFITENSKWNIFLSNTYCTRIATPHSCFASWCCKKWRLRFYQVHCSISSKTAKLTLISTTCRLLSIKIPLQYVQIIGKLNIYSIHIFTWRAP